MAYSPSVQYEGYKRLDFALWASSSVLSFAFVLLCWVSVGFCYIEKCYLFIFSLQNFHRRPPGLRPGTVWAGAQQQHVGPQKAGGSGGLF